MVSEADIQTHKQAQQGALTQNYFLFIGFDFYHILWEIALSLLIHDKRDYLTARNNE